MSSGDTPAGWYPDPGDAASLRWWDGQQWTESTQLSPPSPVESPPAPVRGASPGWGEAPPAGFEPGAQTGFEPGAQTGFGSPFGYGHPSGYGGPSGGPAFGRRPGFGLRGGSGGRHGANYYSFIALGVSGLYLLLALATGFVLIGFIPLAMSLRARRSREPLAPIAIAVAVLVIIVSLARL